jgi:hypothetical protein
MTKRSVDDLYGGRHRPYGQVRDGSHRRIESEPSMEPKRGGAFNSNAVQDPENKHDVKYDNQVADDWRRGGGKGQATGKPNFDFGGAWRQKDKSISHGPGDPAVIRSPGTRPTDRRMSHEQPRRRTCPSAAATETCA